MSAVRTMEQDRRGSPGGLLRRFAPLVLAGGLLLGTSGCAISPKPEPPDPGAEFNLGQITTRTSQSLGPRLFVGGPGAAQPAGAVVRLVNLDLTDDPAEGVVQPDGSFEVELWVEDGDEVRLQLVADELRSEPLDVVVGELNVPPVVAVRPLADCLLLTPATQIDAASLQPIEVRNQCSSAVTFDAPYLRRPVTGLDIGEGHSWPAVLEPDFALSVAVQFDVPADTLEEIVFIESSAPERDRRPITVWPREP